MRNLRVAELVNIYEVFLLCWPLAEIVGEIHASESFKKHGVPVRSDSENSNPKFRKKKTTSLFTKNKVY